MMLFSPRMALTTSRRSSHLTNRLMKVLSAALGAPIYRRGSSTLDEVARACKTHGLTSFIVIYTRKKRPSILTCCKVVNDSYEIVGRIFIIDFRVYPVKGVFTDVLIKLNGKSNGAKVLYDFLYKFWNPYKISESKRYITLVIDDLPDEIRRRTKKEKLNPAMMRFVTPQGATMLEIFTHHIHEYSPPLKPEVNKGEKK